MGLWLCGCGARNALGLLRCPRRGCGQVSPQFAVAVPAAAAEAAASAARRRKAA